MGDFFQNGVITTLHNLGNRPLDDLESDLRTWGASRPMALVIPALASEMDGEGLPGIVEVLAEVDFLDEIIIGLDRADEAGFARARRFFDDVPTPHRILWNEGPRLRAVHEELLARQAGVTAGPGISRLDVIAQIKAKYAEAFKPKPYDFRGYRDTRQEGVFYHGSPDVIESLAEYSYASTNYYGQGFYTSNAIDVIHGYALRRGAARGTAYRVSEKAPVKFYDMEAPLTREQANELRGRGSDLVDDALSERPANLRELYDTMRDISVGRRIPADEVQDDFAAITRGLEEQGFGGMQHTGGLRTNVAEHTVRIYFSPREQLDLAEVSLADFRAPARSPAPDGPRPDPASPATLAAQAVVRDIDTLKAIEAAVEGCRFG